MSGALISKSDLARGTKQFSGIFTGVIAPAIGGIAGFLAPDVLGLETVIGDLIDSLGITGLVPFIANLPLGAFFTAVIYAAIAFAVSRISMDGMIVKTITTAVTWYFGAAACRLMINALMQGVTSIKTVATA